jgi:hypothetical protein
MSATKKQRLAAPAPAAPAPAAPTTALTHNTGAAALHTLLFRIACAQDEYEVLGLDIGGLFEMEVVQLHFEAAFEVLRRDNVMKVEHHLEPIAKSALKRVRWACNVMFERMDMICRTLVCQVARAKWTIVEAIDSDGLD